MEFNEALYIWYKDQLPIQEQKAASQRKYLFRCIKFFMAFIILYAAILFYVFVIFLINSYDLDPSLLYAFFTLGFTAIIICVALGWLVYLLSWERINTFNLMIQKNNIFLFADNKIPEIKSTVIQLAKSMNIDPDLILYWGILNRSNYPSIEEDLNAGQINLLLPINFIMNFNKNKDEGAAILAHELGHVLQKDTQLYLNTDAYFNVIRSLLIPGTIVSIIVQIIFACSKQGLNLIASSDIFQVVIALVALYDIWLLHYLTKGFETLRETRRESEKLADTASVIFANGNALIEVLKRIKESGTNAIATHPDKVERIEHINYLLNPANYVDY
jgi:hypothetical protein